MQQQVPDQKVIKTPYGGRLVVTMPQGNNIVVHFKNKDLIRHKKRWSQVMYLYYLLGWKLNTKYYQLWKKGHSEDQIRLNLQVQNTYLLALDGDTDFQPAAVMLLADRLKMYPQVGAACGRIHPTGSGPAVWFQKFEYAASHWLQKTAEHVFGSVLCSPGCFSLFRAEALMDDNVMRRYATKSTEAIHYVQYDQGEDRWLSTLMLKQGWRVEYNAASDAYTNAPEDFKELYNQRRRWGPSTMANIVDVLGSASLISKKNSSMSKPFMLYQLFAVISGILAPATICLMIAGSLSFIFNIHSAISLVLAVVPPTIYLGLCFKLKPDTQISIAAVLSIIYAIMMMVVTMSIIGSMVKEQTILTPSSIFITVMSGIYIITGILHPQEVHLLFYGVLYIICIPSAYLLLTIYSMVNMNVVSWGTRETKPAVGAAPTTKQTRTQKGWIEQLQKMSSDMRLTDEHLDEEEENFWKELLQRYLYPLPNNKESQEKMHDELRSLRNKITFCFFFLNALWLVSTFVFQVFEVFKISVKIVDLSLEETGGVIEIDPVGLMFILGFALSVLLQFVGMFYHRVNTLIHYIAFLGTEGENKTLNVKEDDTSEDSFHIPAESDSASEFSFATSHYTLSDYDGSDSIYEASSVGTLVRLASVGFGGSGIQAGCPGLGPQVRLVRVGDGGSGDLGWVSRIGSADAAVFLARDESTGLQGLISGEKTWEFFKIFRHPPFTRDESAQLLLDSSLVNAEFRRPPNDHGNDFRNLFFGNRVHPGTGRPTPQLPPATPGGLRSGLVRAESPPPPLQRVRLSLQLHRPTGTLCLPSESPRLARRRAVSMVAGHSVPQEWFLYGVFLPAPPAPLMVAPGLPPRPPVRRDPLGSETETPRLSQPSHNGTCCLRSLHLHRPHHPIRRLGTRPGLGQGGEDVRTSTERGRSNYTWITVSLLELIHANVRRPLQGWVHLSDPKPMRGRSSGRALSALVTLDNLEPIAGLPWQRRLFRMSALSTFDGTFCAYHGDNGKRGIRIRFRRGSLRNCYHIQGRQQQRKLPTPIQDSFKAL
ncbi:chitin synthase chs-2-like [Oryzias melastigma]|uniref:chitin synthase chs-2-like n=1 Tax=Oryzias melastigma TaxID=30732 RepID=UPI00168D4302|nr:chitin synthase chs-2-like [Oryzias melastigma]